MCREGVVMCQLVETASKGMCRVTGGCTVSTWRDCIKVNVLEGGKLYCVNFER